MICRSSHLLVLPAERFGRAVPLQSHRHGHLSPGYSERRHTPRTNAGLLKPQGSTPGDTLESRQRARLWESPAAACSTLPPQLTWRVPPQPEGRPPQKKQPSEPRLHDCGCEQGEGRETDSPRSPLQHPQGSATAGIQPKGSPQREITSLLKPRDPRSSGGAPDKPMTEGH